MSKRMPIGDFRQRDFRAWLEDRDAGAGALCTFTGDGPRHDAVVCTKVAVDERVSMLLGTRVVWRDRDAPRPGDALDSMYASGCRELSILGLVDHSRGEVYPFSTELLYDRPLDERYKLVSSIEDVNREARGRVAGALERVANDPANHDSLLASFHSAPGSSTPPYVGKPSEDDLLSLYLEGSAAEEVASRPVSVPRDRVGVPIDSLSAAVAYIEDPGSFIGTSCSAALSDASTLALIGGELAERDALADAYAAFLEEHAGDESLDARRDIHDALVDTFGSEVPRTSKVWVTVEEQGESVRFQYPASMLAFSCESTRSAVMDFYITPVSSRDEFNASFGHEMPVSSVTDVSYRKKSIYSRPARPCAAGAVSERAAHVSAPERSGPASSRPARGKGR